MLTVQIACLLHDASEAYLSDITRPVKKHLPNYIEIEKHLRAMIYGKFIGSFLSEEEAAYVGQIDHDILIYEFNALMKKKVLDETPNMKSNPSLEYIEFTIIENEFIKIYNENRRSTK